MKSHIASIVANYWHIKNRIEVNDLVVHAGEFVHVLGANGAGKSSLLEGLAGVMDVSHGEISLLGRPLNNWSLAELSYCRAYLGQAIACQFELCVADVIGFFSDHQKIPDDIEAALEIRAFLAVPLSRLSGGQQQRVHIARALLQVWAAVQNGSALLILDEPLQQLDIAHQQSCLRLFKALAERGNTVVISSHDINLSHQFASTVMLLKAGKVLCSGAPQSVLTVELLKTAFACDFDLIYSENSYPFFHPKVNS